MAKETFSYTGQLLNVTGKPVRNGILYEVTFADGSVAATKKPELATRAQALQLKNVTAQIGRSDPKPKNDGSGFWPASLWLEDIAEAVPGATAPMHPAVPVVDNGAAQTTPVPGIPMIGNAEEFQRRMHPDVEARVTRLASIGAAAQLFQGAGPEALNEMLEVAQQIYTVAYGSQNVVPAAQTPEAVAEAVNAVAGAPVVGVGSTPDW